MRTKTLIISFFFLFLMFCCGKKKAHLFLLNNESFELSGVGSLSGWYYYSDPAITALYSNNTPPGGGSWSLNLWSNNPPSYYARKYFTGHIGNHVYRVNGWISDLNLTGGPLIKIGKFSGNTFFQMKIISSSATTTSWMNYEIYDTITTNVGDTIALEVNGGYSPVGGTGLFDLLTVEKIE